MSPSLRSQDTNGPKENFHTNRQLGVFQVSQKSREFMTPLGWTSSTSISAALGMAIASNLKGDLDKQHIAVIGDASIAGMAFEGLNHAGVTDATYW
jgi:1-deoxy-D-xylulose-5-phosphate synthase